MDLDVLVGLLDRGELVELLRYGRPEQGRELHAGLLGAPAEVVG
jgi:hypothetical protein